jgi:transcriptional regulator with XRE-family HTH domain
VSKITGKIKTIWKRLADPDYRESFVAAKVANEIAFQVFYLREHRGWTQGELASRADTQQPSISRLERSIGNVNVATLLKVARAFNVGLSIRFVPFSKLVSESVTGELSARIPNFDDDCAPLPIEKTHRAAVGGNALIQINNAAFTPAVPLKETELAGGEQLLIVKHQTAASGEGKYGHH